MWVLGNISGNYFVFGRTWYSLCWTVYIPLLHSPPLLWEANCSAGSGLSAMWSLVWISAFCLNLRMMHNKWLHWRVNSHRVCCWLFIQASQHVDTLVSSFVISSTFSMRLLILCSEMSPRQSHLARASRSQTGGTNGYIGCRASSHFPWPLTGSIVLRVDADHFN